MPSAVTHPLLPFHIITITCLLLAEVWALILFVRMFISIQVRTSLHSAPSPLTLNIQIGNGYIISITSLKLGFQKRLRIMALGCYLVCNILRLLMYYLETTRQRALYLFEDRQFYFLSLVFSITFWVGYGCYILAVLDRYQRIEMIVPKSTKYRVYRAIHFSIGLSLLFISVCQSICHTTWIIYHPEHTCPYVFQKFIDLFVLATGLYFVIIELTVNVRLVVGSLRIGTAFVAPNPLQQQAHSITQNESSPDLATTQQLSVSPVYAMGTSTNKSAENDDISLHPIPNISNPRHSSRERVGSTDFHLDIARTQRRQQRKRLYFKSIRHEMIFYFILLVLMDLSIIGMYLIAGIARPLTLPFAHLVPINELDGWSSALVCLHLYFGFKLLDLFLLKLQEARQMIFETQAATQTDTSNSRTLATQLSSLTLNTTETGAEIVRDGLLPTNMSLTIPIVVPRHSHRLSRRFKE